MQNTDYLLNNLVNLIRIDKFSTLFFLLENNRTEFLTVLKKAVPKILLNPFFAEIESKDNYEIAEFLAAYLTKEDYKNLNKFTIPYNLGAENWTTDQRAKEFFNIPIDEEERGAIGDFGDWFTTFATGKTETATTTTTTDVSNKNTTIAIIGVIGLIFILSFVYFKFANNGK